MRGSRPITLAATQEGDLRTVFISRLCSALPSRRFLLHPVVRHLRRKCNGGSRREGFGGKKQTDDGWSIVIYNVGGEAVQDKFFAREADADGCLQEQQALIDEGENG
ncbi:hypothetical protein B5K11_25035 [Rhizobium leguminosarum bv. trifolii]|nr:hypothetical protein B5K11_25035 [Rhizobium leguminosarum bv. trifolii]